MREELHVPYPGQDDELPIGLDEEDAKKYNSLRKN